MRFMKIEAKSVVKRQAGCFEGTKMFLDCKSETYMRIEKGIGKIISLYTNDKTNYIPLSKHLVNDNRFHTIKGKLNEWAGSLSTCVTTENTT